MRRGFREDVEDVIIGCAMPEGTQGYNVARLSSLLAGMPDTVPAQTVNRFCSSGLQTIAMASSASWSATRRPSWRAVPSTCLRPSRAQLFAQPAAYGDQPCGLYGHGPDCGAGRPRVRRGPPRPGRVRPAQPPLAKDAVEGGVFDEEIVPLDVEFDWVDKPVQGMQETSFGRDEGPRDTSAEKLANLKPAFQQDGTVTAGNSQMSGAAAVVVMDREEAEKRGLTPLVRFVGFAVGGVRPEVMGIGPTVAIPKVLEQTGLTMDDIDLIEFNEAFAAQAPGRDPRGRNGPGEDQCQRRGHSARPSDGRDGHEAHGPAHPRDEARSKYGLVTMCIGGGMGAAGIFENLQN